MKATAWAIDRAVTVTDRYFQRVVLVAFTIGFVALMLAGGAAVLSVDRNREFTYWVDHTYRVEDALSSFSTLSERLEATRRGVLLQRDDLFLATYVDTMRRLPPLLERIAVLTADNARQQQRIARLRALATEHQASVRASITQMASDDAATRALADFGVDGSAVTMRSLRGVLSEMINAERALLEVRRAEQAAGVRTLLYVLGGTGFLVVVVAGGALWTILRYTRDLNRSRADLRGLNENLEDAVAERTTELSRANDEIQRFAYIVSHDLRSPLVNVMGFTAELEATIAPLSELIDRAEAEAPELVTPDARAAAKEDLPEAIGFIRTSTAKMDRLINSILRLSREGRRTLAPARLDLDALVGGIRDGVRHRLNELDAEIAIEAPLPAIVSDRLAIEQILSNLVENAVKYLDPKRAGRIVVRGRREGRRAVIEVADNGRGIDPRDHERIFDLFRRSGVQDQPGEGLGLAHVRALAYRLGGVISCRSALGEGATFTLSLPLELVEQGHPG